MHLYDTYVYLRIPWSLDVQIITLLSAEPEANCFPAIYTHVFTTVCFTMMMMAGTKQHVQKVKATQVPSFA